LSKTLAVQSCTHIIHDDDVRANRAGHQAIGTAMARGKELAKTPIIGAKKEVEITGVK
jgi:hypothetical protein